MPQPCCSPPQLEQVSIGPASPVHNGARLRVPSIARSIWKTVPKRSLPRPLCRTFANNPRNSTQRPGRNHREPLSPCPEATDRSSASQYPAKDSCNKQRLTVHVQPSPFPAAAPQQQDRSSTNKRTDIPRSGIRKRPYV